MQILQNFDVHHSSVLIAFFFLTLIRGFSYSVVIPPWQAPDESGHLEYAILLSEKGWLPTREDTSPSLQREILSSMKKFQFWKYVRQPEPEQIPVSFSDDPFLARSGTQLGDEAPLYYLFPAIIFALTRVEDILIQLYIMRWFSVILSGVTVVVSSLIARELFSEDRFMIVAIPTFVAFLPMFSFIGASANNDSLTFVVASLLIWQLVRLLRRGVSWRSGLVICILTLLSALSKKTLFAVPLVIVALLVCLWGRHVVVRGNYRTVGAPFFVLAMLLLGIMLTWREGDAAGWVEQPEAWRDTRSYSVARSGRYSLHVVDDTPQFPRRLMQSVPTDLVRELRGKMVTLHAWVRSARGEQEGCLLIAGAGERSYKVFVATESWSSQSLTCIVSSEAKSIRVALVPRACGKEGTGDLYFDDVALLENGGEGSNLLRNGSGEVALPHVWPRLERFLTLRVWPLLQRFAKYVSLMRFFDLRSFDIPSLKKYVLYFLLTFAGFWANFGWLTLPLDPPWYALLALITLIAVIGLGFGSAKVLLAWRREDSEPPPWRCKALALLLTVVCLIILQTFLPMIGRDWQPQGRYMFPAIVPIAALFSLGWREVVPRRWHVALVVAWILAFCLFDALCLFGYVYPYFHG